MTAFAFRLLGRAALALCALFAVFGLASCGSGAVGGNPPANDPNRITILPGDGTVLYGGLPTTFNIAGGTGQYIVTSSNQTVLPIPSNPRPTFTVVPNPVAADTQVTITVRDTGATPIATALVTVKPGTINNDIIITPSSTQPAGCPAGTLCSGGDAFVSVTLSQGGVALPGRTVRFDAVSGDFRFITSASGSPAEVLSTTAFAVTDESGRASVRIRALAAVPNQTAILQVTDVASGASRQVAFTIAQSTGEIPGFFASPSSYTFQGSLPGQCASVLITPNLSATFYIFGGTPPYTITSPSSGIVVTRESVSSQGGSFDVRPTGACLTDVPIVIRDASGHTTTVTVSNTPGTAPATPLVVSPDTVTLSSCSSVAQVTAAGGTGSYVATSGSGGVYAIPVGSGSRTFQIGRLQGTGAQTSPVSVGITDGVTNQSVTVNLVAQALGPCPAPAFDAQPRNVQLATCTGTVEVSLSGGSGVYTANSDNNALKLTLSGNSLSIGRNPGPGGVGDGIVTVSDGNTSIPISVDDRIAPATTCS